jgi:hypothetical protein
MLLTTALAALLVATSLGALVNPSSAGNDGHGSGFVAISASYPNAIAAGDTLWASIINDQNTTITVSSVSGGGTWSKACAETDSFSHEEIWYAPNVSAQASGVTVTAMVSGGSNGVYLFIHEVKNVRQTSPVDTASCIGTTGNNVSAYTTGNTTYSGNNDWVVSALGVTSNTINAGTGYTLQSTPQSGNLHAVDEAGAIAPGVRTTTFTGSTVIYDYSIVAVGFLPPTSTSSGSQGFIF